MTVDTLIFFGVVLAVLVLFLIICFFIIRAIFRFIISLFKKEPKEHTMEGALTDKGEDLGVYVEELEKSKEERAKIQAKKQQAATIKYNQPIQKKEAEKEVQKDKEQEWAEKTQKEIKEGLSKLKTPGAEEEKPFLEQGQEDDSRKQPGIGGIDPDSKIKIPVVKGPSVGGGISAPAKQEENAKDKPSQTQEQREVSPDNKNQTLTPSESVIQKSRMEDLKSSDVKVSKGVLPKNLEEFAKIRDLNRGSSSVEEKVALTEKEESFFKKPDFMKKEKIISKNTRESSGQKSAKPEDAPIFGGKEEISRMNLREKLREDAAVLRAGREAGLRMTPLERAKLEKQVFSQSLGGNISKSDLRWSIKKLNDKLFSTKNPTEHAKIRKEIKFFKKIGGIK